MSWSLPSFIPQVDVSELFQGVFQGITVIELVRGAVLLFLGFIVAKIISTLVGRATRLQASQHQTMLISKVIYYVIIIIFLLLSLDQIVDVTTLMGATGILALAIGFGCRTTTSNIIGGMFLIGEQPFVIGDFLLVNGIIGEVIALDLLSIKLRTEDNVSLRVPNDYLLKFTFQNLSRFPIRRLDITIKAGFYDEIDKLKEVLLKLADDAKLCLQYPLPKLFFQEFTESNVQLQFTCWVKNADYDDLQTYMIEQIQKSLKVHEIKIPYQARVIHKVDE